MRQIQTYILRVFVDPAEPEALRGALQPVPEGETQPFASDWALLTLLRQLASEATGAPDGRTPSGGNENDGEETGK
jgi:hypothetical protein